MVIKDLSQPETLPRNASDQVRVAPVSDRALALFFDFLIFSPVVSLFGAGLLKEIKTNLMLDAQSSLAFLQWGLFALIVFAVTCTLQSLFIFFWQATPGQRFFHLRVISWPHADQPLTYSRAIVRSFFWCLSVLSLGIPFLEILGHPYRRAFHERGSDTMVVTLKDVEAAPLWIESRFVGSWMSLFFGGIIVFAAMATSSLWNHHVKSAQTQKSTPKALVTKVESLICAEVEDAEKAGEITATQRIDFALALWMSDKSFEECLDKEADWALWHSKGQEDKASTELAWAYLAKSQLNSDKKIQLQYLNKVCEVGNKTDVCELSFIIKAVGLNQDRIERIRSQSLTAKILAFQAAIANQEMLAVGKNYRALKVYPELLDSVKTQYLGAIWKYQESFKEQKAEAQGPEFRQPASEVTVDEQVVNLKVYKQVIEEFKKEFSIP